MPGHVLSYASFLSYIWLLNVVCRAMGDQLEGNEEEHMKYRAMVVEYIVVCGIAFCNWRTVVVPMVSWTSEGL